MVAWYTGVRDCVGDNSDAGDGGGGGDCGINLSEGS